MKNNITSKAELVVCYEAINNICSNISTINDDNWLFHYPYVEDKIKKAFPLHTKSFIQKTAFNIMLRIKEKGKSVKWDMDRLAITKDSIIFQSYLYNPIYENFVLIKATYLYSEDYTLSYFITEECLQMAHKLLNLPFYREYGIYSYNVEKCQIKDLKSLFGKSVLEILN